MAVSGPKQRAGSPIHDAGIAGPKAVANLVTGTGKRVEKDDEDSALKIRSRATSVIRRVAMGDTSKPAVELGETPKPPAQPVELGDTPKPAVELGDTPNPPAQPVAMGDTPKPPVQPGAVALVAVDPPEPVALGETPEPPAVLAPVAPVTPVALVEAAEPASSEPTPTPIAPLTIARRSVPPPPVSSGGELRALVDPTQRPPDARPSAAESTPSPASPSKPLLASEALMEDLAPVQPARRDARIWCLACGVGFILFGILPLLGLLPGALGAALPWLVTGVISLLAGIFDVTYRQRAVAMLVLGLLTGLVALQGSGTLVRADGGAGWGVARLFSVVTLTAALLFRARYRAYAGARVFLATALVISVPFVLHAALVFWSDAGFGPAHVGAILVLVSIAATLIGFMGSETTGAGPYVASALVFTVALELASRGIAVVGISSGLSPLLGVLVGASGFGAAAGFTALGLFQILAWRFAEDARRIDIHSPLRDRAPKSEHDPMSEWSTRE